MSTLSQRIKDLKKKSDEFADSQNNVKPDFNDYLNSIKKNPREQEKEIEKEKQKEILRKEKENENKYGKDEMLRQDLDKKHRKFYEENRKDDYKKTNFNKVNEEIKTSEKKKSSNSREDARNKRRGIFMSQVDNNDDSEDESERSNDNDNDTLPLYDDSGNGDRLVEKEYNSENDKKNKKKSKKNNDEDDISDDYFKLIDKNSPKEKRKKIKENLKKKMTNEEFEEELNENSDDDNNNDNEFEDGDYYNRKNKKNNPVYETYKHLPVLDQQANIVEDGYTFYPEEFNTFPIDYKIKNITEYPKIISKTAGKYKGKIRADAHNYGFVDYRLFKDPLNDSDTIRDDESGKTIHRMILDDYELKLIQNQKKLKIQMKKILMIQL